MDKVELRTAVDFPRANHSYFTEAIDLFLKFKQLCTIPLTQPVLVTQMT